MIPACKRDAGTPQTTRDARSEATNWESPTSDPGVIGGAS